MTFAHNHERTLETPRAPRRSPATGDLSNLAGLFPTGSPHAALFVHDDPQPTGRGRSLPHVASLDGLRGLAVVGVLLFHGGVAFTGGFLGVSTFFTLSGFLITSLLLAEHDRRHRIDSRQFWNRRFRRLLPAAMLAIVLAAVFVATAGDVSQLRTFRADALSALGYVANWRFIASSQSYAVAFATPSPVLQFWSLAIEEQFYLLFPLLTIVVLRAARGSKRVFASVIACSIAVSTALPHLFGWSWDRVYFGTDTRAAELLCGALLSVVLSLRGTRLDEVGRAWRPATRGMVAIAGPVALVAVLVSWWSTSQSTPWVSTGGLTVYAGLTVLVIVAALVPANPVRVALSVRPLTQLGRISYGVYLYHWPVFLWLSAERTGWPDALRMLVGTAVTLGIAIASFVLIEQPIRERRPIFGRPAPKLGKAVPVAIGMVAVIAVAVTVNVPATSLDAADKGAGSLVSDLPGAGNIDISAAALAAPTPNGPAGPDGNAGPATIGAAGLAREPSNDSASAAPSAGDPAGAGGDAATKTTQPAPLVPKPVRAPSRALRVIVVGDSTAMYLDPGLNEWGETNKIWSAFVFARLGCGIGRTGERMYHDAPEWVPHDCTTWATEWPKVLQEYKPDIVVIASNYWDATDRRLLNDDTWRAPGDPVYDDYLRSEFGAATDVLSSMGAAVVWLDNPRIEVRSKDRNYDSDEAMRDPARMRHTNEILADIATTRPSMRVIPYSRFIEGWPGGPFDPALRPDGLHVDLAGGQIVAKWMGPEILDAYWSIRGT